MVNTRYYGIRTVIVVNTLVEKTAGRCCGGGRGRGRARVRGCGRVAFIVNEVPIGNVSVNEHCQAKALSKRAKNSGNLKGS